MKITALLDALNSALAEPFALAWSQDSPRFLLVFTVIYAVVLIVAVSDQKNTRPGAEHGSAAWGDVFRLNKFYMDKRGPNLLLTQHFHIGIDGYKHKHNTNILIVGGSGAGKTRTYGVPNVLECACSMVITDPKAEILRKTGNLLKEKGYEVIVFDLINPAASFCYNPFVYVHDDREVLTLIENLIQNTTPSHSKSSDPFWEKSETALLQAFMLYLLHEAPPEEQNFPMVMEMKRMAPGCTNTVEYEIYGLDGSAKFSTEDANAVWYTRNQGREQAWSRLILGQRTLFPVITGGIFEFGFSDAMLQMFAAFIAELCGEPCAFGCFRPDEALLSHQLLTGALRAYETGSVVRLD